MEGKRIFLGLLVLFVKICISYTAASEDVKALVGSEVALPCRVNTELCGELHSVKFYRETSRIFVYSQAGGGKGRGEGDARERMNVTYTAKDTVARLMINRVEVEDEAIYKCEVTYLEVREDCDVVQIIKLSTLVKPSNVSILSRDGTPLDNASVLGPYNEGMDIELICQVYGGRPTPKVTWYNNTEIMKSTYKTIDNGFGIDTVIAKLQVTLRRGDLNKDYKCVVENIALEEPIISWVTADVNVKPTDIKLFGVKGQVNQGTIVTLVCDVTGAKPEAEVQWYNASVPIHKNLISTELKAMPDGTITTTSTLKFTATHWENGNAFDCNADNSVMRDQQESSIHDSTVLTVYYPPIVSVSPLNKTVNETDRDVLLICSYTSNPSKLEEASWSKDGVPITGDKYEGGNRENLSLIIKNVTRDDRGNYTCTCRNDAGSSESEDSIILDVQFPPSVELRIFPSKPVRAIDEKNVTLVCNVLDGNPSALSRVKWFFGGELLKELPECNGTSYDENGEDKEPGGLFCQVDPHVLTLEYVSEGFAGNYTCQGYNIAGWGSQSEPQELIVYYPPSPATLSATPKNVVKKGSVTLICKVNDPGKPENLTYVWYRGSSHITEITTYNWTITPVTYATKSNYTCHASNEGGNSTSASIYVDVSAKPAFIQNLQPYQGILFTSNNISLTCRVECSPICSLTWLLNGKELEVNKNKLYALKTTNYSAESEKNDFESVESTLIFNMREWPGEQLDKTAPNSVYACQSSSNAIGPGVTSTMEIAVDYPPENLTVSNSLVHVIENRTPETIICTGKGHPALHYTWRKDSATNYSSSTNKLSLKTVNRSDTGKYICEAVNKHGKASTIAFLNVRYLPSCKLELQESNGVQSLECIATANPQDVTFRFQIKGENDTIDSSLITREGVKGYFQLDSDTDRTYQCFVNNSVGTGVPCERDVTGRIAWWKQILGDNLIIPIAILAGIILIIILCIIIILICRRKRSNNKLPNQSSLGDKGGLGAAPTTGNTADPLGDPDKLFYENLPFHGMQNPPNKPISIISPIVQINRPTRLMAQPSSMMFNNSLHYPSQHTITNNRVFRNQSFHGFQSECLQNSRKYFPNANSISANVNSQTKFKNFSYHNLQSINFLSPLYSPYDILSNSNYIQNNSPFNRNQCSILSPSFLNTTLQNAHRVVGRNETKLDIRKAASEINSCQSTINVNIPNSSKSQTLAHSRKSSTVQTVKKIKLSENKRFSSLNLRKHKCYSPTFYSMRCKKHAKKRPVIYTIFKSSKTSSEKSHPSENNQTVYQNLSDSVQIFEQNIENSENESRKAPRPAPRCKKHRKKKEIIYENIANVLAQNLNSSNESSISEAEVSVTEAIVHTNKLNGNSVNHSNEQNVVKDNNSPNKSTEFQSTLIEKSKISCKKEVVKSVDSKETNKDNTDIHPTVIKSPVSYVKVTPTVKVSPNFIKPLTESPKGALNTQLHAKLKHLSSNASTQTSNQGLSETKIEISTSRNKSLKNPINSSPSYKGIKSFSKSPKPVSIEKLQEAIPTVPVANVKVITKKADVVISSNKNAFYTLTTPGFKHSTKPPLPQQYSATIPHQKHIKLIPRSLFQEQQINKSKSFSSKTKPKKHFQIPLQKCHSFKFQTAESYFQPIKNIHEENLMRNGYASDIGSVYRDSHHNNYNHKKDVHKLKGSFVIRRPNEYQENIQFQENMQNSVQLQYPQPVLARSSIPKANGIVYADLDIAKKSSTNNTFLESSLSLSKTQKTKPKTEYATLKFNDIGQEIDV